MEESYKIPHSEKAERALLGAMLGDADRVIPLVLVHYKLTTEALHVHANQVVFDAIKEVFDRPKGRVDILVVSEHLAQAGTLAQVGGSSYLDQCIDECITPAHVEHYLQIVRNHWIRRRVINTSRQLMQQAYADEDAEKVLTAAPQLFMEAGLEMGGDEVPNSVILAEIRDEWEENSRRRQAGEDVVLAGLPSPYAALDRITCGFGAGLHIIAGRPSHGKTTLEDNCLSYLAQLGHPVLRITLDMDRKRLLQRNLSRLGGVSLPKMNLGYGNRANIASVNEGVTQVGDWPMFINNSARDIRAICSLARSLKLRHGLKAMSVDYIQLIQVEGAGKYLSENEKITHASEMLKSLGFELDIPVLGISQLSRESERSDRPPKLSDLRGSGSLEQAATTVTMVYKDNKKAKECETPKLRPVWIDVQKNQDGETGSLEMWMRPNYFMFERAEEDWADASHMLAKVNGKTVADEAVDFDPTAEIEMQPVMPGV